MTVNGSVSWQGALNDRNRPFFAGRRLDVRRLPLVARHPGVLRTARPSNWVAAATSCGPESTSRRTAGTSPSTGTRSSPPRVTTSSLSASTGPSGPATTFPQTAPRPSSTPPTTGSGPAVHSTPRAADTGDSWRAPALAVADRSTVTRPALRHRLQHRPRPALVRGRHGHLGQPVEPPRAPGPAALPAWVVRTDGARPAVGLRLRRRLARRQQRRSSHGALDSPTTLDLYATRLPLGDDTVVELTHRADAGQVTVELAVATAEPAGPGEPHPYTFLPVGSAGTGWTTTTVPLTGLDRNRPRPRRTAHRHRRAR